MSELRWEDPPHTNRLPGPSVYRAVAAELKRRPGEWALIREGLPKDSARSLAYALRQGRFGFDPVGAYGVVSRSNGDTGAIYARYVGEQSHG